MNSNNKKMSYYNSATRLDTSRTSQRFSSLYQTKSRRPSLFSRISRLSIQIICNKIQKILFKDRVRLMSHLFLLKRQSKLRVSTTSLPSSLSRAQMRKSQSLETQREHISFSRQWHQSTKVKQFQKINLVLSKILKRKSFYQFRRATLALQQKLFVLAKFTDLLDIYPTKMCSLGFAQIFMTGEQSVSLMKFVRLSSTLVIRVKDNFMAAIKRLLKASSSQKGFKLLIQLYQRRTNKSLMQCMNSFNCQAKSKQSKIQRLEYVFNKNRTFLRYSKAFQSIVRFNCKPACSVRQPILQQQRFYFTPVKQKRFYQSTTNSFKQTLQVETSRPLSPQLIPLKIKLTPNPIIPLSQSPPPQNKLIPFKLVSLRENAKVTICPLPPAYEQKADFQFKIAQNQLKKDGRQKIQPKKLGVSRSPERRQTIQIKQIKGRNSPLGIRRVQKI